MKALLVEDSIVFVKTHDLVFLMESRGAMLAGFDSLREALARLSAYAVTFRYPGEEAINEEGKEAIDTAADVCAIIRRHFGLK